MQQHEKDAPFKEQAPLTFDRLIYNTKVHAIQLNELKEQSQQPVTELDTAVRQFLMCFHSREEIHEIIDDLVLAWQLHNTDEPYGKPYLADVHRVCIFMHRFIRLVQENPLAKQF